MPQPPNTSLETDTEISTNSESQSPIALPTLSRMPTEKYTYVEEETNLRRTYAVRFFNPGEFIASTPEQDAINYNNSYTPKGPE